MKQNSELSLSRRFTRWYRFHDGNIAIFLIVLLVLLCIIFCITLHNKYKNELESYDEAHYQYLTAIVFNIWDEDTKSLRIDYIPKNVKITDANISNSVITFKCHLTNTTSLLPAPFVNVHISEDFNVDITHYTESEFLSNTKFEFIMFNFACCVLILLAEAIVWGLIIILIYFFCGLYDFTKNFMTKTNKT